MHELVELACHRSCRVAVDLGLPEHSRFARFLKQSLSRTGRRSARTPRAGPAGPPATASASGTIPISVPCSAAISPIRRRGRRRSPPARAAWPARGRTRSGCRRAGRGRARSRGSRSRCALDLALQHLADPAQAGMAELVGLAGRHASASPPSASRPRRRRRSRSSGPRSWRRRISRHTSSMSNGCSGIRITSAPPAIPEWSAIHPALRPITSTTRIRLWLSAVVCRRSIASVATCSAVSNPNVTSVAPRSLSIVFGTPITGRPSVGQPVGDAERVLAADRDQTVEPVALERGADRAPAPSSRLYGLVRLPRIVPPAGQDPAGGLDRQRRAVVLQHPAPAVGEARAARRRSGRSPCARRRG